MPKGTKLQKYNCARDYDSDLRDIEELRWIFLAVLKKPLHYSKAYNICFRVMKIKLRILNATSIIEVQRF